MFRETPSADQNREAGMEPTTTSQDADVSPPSGTPTRHNQYIDRLGLANVSTKRELGSDGMPARKLGRVGKNSGSYISTASSVRHPDVMRTSREQRTKHVMSNHGQREVESLLRLNGRLHGDGSEAPIISGGSDVINRGSVTTRSSRWRPIGFSTTPTGKPDNDSRTSKLESWLHDVSREAAVPRGGTQDSGSRYPFPSMRTTSGTTIGHLLPDVSASKIADGSQSPNQYVGRRSNESLIITDDGVGVRLPYDAASLTHSHPAEQNRRKSPPFDPSVYQHPSKHQMSSVCQTSSGIMRTKKAAPRSVSFYELPSVESAKCEPNCRSSCGKSCIHSPPHYLEPSNKHEHICPILKHGLSTRKSPTGARMGATCSTTINASDGFSGRRGPCKNAWPCGCMKHVAANGWCGTGYARVDGSKPQTVNSCRAHCRSGSNRCAATMPNPMWTGGYGYSAATKSSGGRSAGPPGSVRSASGRHPACTGCNRCVGSTSNNNRCITAKATVSTHRSKKKVKTTKSRGSPIKRKVTRTKSRASARKPSVRQAPVRHSTWNEPVSPPKRLSETMVLPTPSSNGVFAYFRRTFGKLIGY